MKSFSAAVKSVWSKNTPRETDQYVGFRRRFVTEQDGVLTMRVFANTYYDLYIDGAFLHRGPIRRHEACTEYDEIECRLSAGSHTVAVLVHWLGVEAAAHRKGKASFWFQGEGCGASFVTDESWKAAFLDAFDSDGELISCYDFRENVDLRRLPDWTARDFDDSAWENAAVLWEVGSADDFCRNYSKRRMKLFTYEWETGVILHRGLYIESDKKNDYFFDRMLARTRDEEAGDGSFAVVGFQATVSGTARVFYSGTMAGDELILGYDDMLNADGFPMPGRIMRYGDRFILPEGDGSVEVLMPRGFRYLLVDLSGSGKIERVDVRKEIYPYQPNGVSVGDPFFAALYEQCLRTQHICTIDGYTDCVSRERVLWLGDAWIDTMSAYYAEPDEGLLLTTMFEHAMGQVASGAIGGYNASDLQPDWLHMPSYNMMFLHMLCDYILYTGREDGILPLKETAKGILRFISDNFNANGLYDSRYKGQGDFWDWGGAAAPGQQLRTNAFFIYTVERLAKCSALADLAKPYLPLLDGMRAKCCEILWDEKRGVFRDACLIDEEPDPLVTQQGNALAVLADICPKERQNELLERILDPKELDRVPFGENQEGTQFTINKSKISPPGTMFAAMFVAVTLFEKKRYDLAIPYMREVWGPYRDLPTLPELRFNGPNNTMCHGWSGGPGYLIPRYVCGLYPGENGWKTAILEPLAAGIPSAGAQITTPHGKMTACWTADEAVLQVRAELPEGVSLKIRWGGEEQILTRSNDLRILLR